MMAIENKCEKCWNKNLYICVSVSKYIHKRQVFHTY